jgi:transposase
VLLMAAEGLANESIAKVAGTSPGTVRSWRAWFEEEGLAKLGKVRAGRGRKPVIPQSTIDEIVELTRNSKPEGHTHWSVRTMAARVGVSPAQVQRIWAARGLKPHGDGCGPALLGDSAHDLVGQPVDSWQMGCPYDPPAQETLGPICREE